MTRWPVWSRRLLWLCVAVLAALLCVSLALTVTVLSVARLYLPAGEILAYSPWLADAVAGQVHWPALLERHNGVHLIAAPKLVYLLDALWTDGSGLLCMAVSLLALLACAALLLRHLLRLPALLRAERVLLGLLVLLLLTAAIHSESLLNQINLQWSLLALGLVLLAEGLLRWVQARRRSALLCLLTGLGLALTSGGPWPVLLAALLGVPVLLAPGLAQWRRRLAWGLPAALLALLLWEVINLGGLQWHRPLLLLLYQDRLEPELLREIERLLQARPLWGYLLWLQTVLGFLGHFLAVPLGRTLAEGWLWLPGLLLPLLLLWLPRQERWGEERYFWTCLSLSVLCLALSAGVFRAVTVWGGYSLRFASPGLLAVAVLLLLGYARLPLRWRPAAALALCLYGFWFLGVNGRQADEVVDWTQFPQLSQVAYSVGVEDAAAIAPMPGTHWQDKTAAQVRTMAPLLQAQGLGIFSAPGYRVFAGQQDLPAPTVACEHRLLALHRHRQDPRAFHLSVQSRDSQGQGLRWAVIRDAQGQALGYGLRVLPSQALRGRFWRAGYWRGHLKFQGSLPAAVVVTVFDDRHRCADWVVPLDAG